MPFRPCWIEKDDLSLFYQAGMQGGGEWCSQRSRARPEGCRLSLQAKFQTTITRPIFAQNNRRFIITVFTVRANSNCKRGRRERSPPPQRSSRDPARWISPCWSERCFDGGPSSWDTQTLPGCRTPIQDLQHRTDTKKCKGWVQPKTKNSVTIYSSSCQWTLIRAQWNHFETRPHLLQFPSAWGWSTEFSFLGGLLNYKTAFENTNISLKHCCSQLRNF